MKTSHLSTQAILLFCLALFGCGSSSPANDGNEPDEGARSETPASNPPQSDSSDNASLASESLEILNSIRSSSRRCGFTNYSASGPLTWNSKLEAAANAHLKD